MLTHLTTQGISKLICDLIINNTDGAKDPALRVHILVLLSHESQAKNQEVVPLKVTDCVYTTGIKETELI